MRNQEWRRQVQSLLGAAPEINKPYNIDISPSPSTPVINSAPTSIPSNPIPASNFHSTNPGSTSEGSFQNSDKQNNEHNDDQLPPSNNGGGSRPPYQAQRSDSAANIFMNWVTKTLEDGTELETEVCDSLFCWYCKDLVEAEVVECEGCGMEGDGVEECTQQGDKCTGCGNHFCKKHIKEQEWDALCPHPSCRHAISKYATYDLEPHLTAIVWRCSKGCGTSGTLEQMEGHIFVCTQETISNCEPCDTEQKAEEHCPEFNSIGTQTDLIIPDQPVETWESIMTRSRAAANRNRQSSTRHPELFCAFCKADDFDSLVALAEHHSTCPKISC